MAEREDFQHDEEEEEDGRSKDRGEQRRAESRTPKGKKEGIPPARIEKPIHFKSAEEKEAFGAAYAAAQAGQQQEARAVELAREQAQELVNDSPREELEPAPDKEKPLPENPVLKYFAENWRAFKGLPEKWNNEIEADIALVDADYDSQERWAEKLPPGKWRNFQTSGFMKAGRKVDRLGERAWAVLGPTFRRPLTSLGVVGGMAILGLGRLADKTLGPFWKKFKEFTNEFTLGQAFKDEAGHGKGDKKGHH